jgi:hypothetical protein
MPFFSIGFDLRPAAVKSQLHFRKNGTQNGLLLRSNTPSKPLKARRAGPRGFAGEALMKSLLAISSRYEVDFFGNVLK